MKRVTWLLSGSLLLTSALAIAAGPESLLPPGFDRPAAKAPPKTVEVAPKAASATAAPSTGTPATASASGMPVALPSNLPSLDKLQTMSPDELADLLGNKPKVDMPPGARRAMKRMGVIDEGEGGLPAWTLAHQNASLVRAVLAGNNGQMISRWGHILLRRALASRLDAPVDMAPAEFVALRAGLLLRLGEGEAARALVQDVDVANYSPVLTQAAIDAYVATSDFTGACPAVSLQGGARRDRQWQVLQGICNAFSSNGTRGLTQLDHIGPGDGFAQVDLLLAQKYAGSAGRAQRAVTIEWANVNGMTPWRYSLALAVGIEPPSDLMGDAPLSLRAMAATSPAASLLTRAAAADYAGATGVLSSTTMIDLYSQIYASGASGDFADRANELQSAYLATSPGDRLAAIKQIWGDANGTEAYARQVLTAYAAARLPIDDGWSSDASALIASMLTAGLDANALRWGPVVKEGSEGWALIMLSQPGTRAAVGTSAIDTFHKDDKSDDNRKTQFLVAGLAGLGRLPLNNAVDLARQYEFALDRPSRWTQMIDKAAEVGNPTLVALLAGVGMQGTGWDKMTARNLFHIVAALNRVGLSAEARMIAAEAVARG